MTKWIHRAAYVLAAAAAVTTASADTNTSGKTTSSKMTKHDALFVSPGDIKWGTAPPDLPKGAELGVLFGDPSKPAPFVVRIKAPDGYKIAPHWHSKDEQLTVISGTLQLYMGDTMSGEPHDLSAGSFHFLPAKAHHAAQAKGDTIVQINGVGPFDIHYLNPEDNPNPKPKTAKR
jgi:quercetin dioxygenase-like cupin family protein